MTTTRGRFITLEGTEGAGKSTQVPVIVGTLESFDIEVVHTREPGGTALGERLRAVLLEESQPICADAEVLLMFAARSQLIRSVIEPALARGAWVVCDRFSDATFAYQGGGRGISFDRIDQVAQWVQRGLQPDLTIFLDANAAARTIRTSTRHRELDRIEREDVEFFERVRTAYLRLVDLHPQRIVRIDANPPLAEVSQAIIRLLNSKIDQWPVRVEC